MDGTPALDLWHLNIEMLHSAFIPTEKSKEKVQGHLLRNRSSRKHTNTQTKTQIQHNDLELSNVDCVSSNVKSSHSGALLYIFEDTEAVIKKIIKGRSPTMRLMCYLTESFSTQRSKSNTWTSKTNSQTY